MSENTSPMPSFSKASHLSFRPNISCSICEKRKFCVFLCLFDEKYESSEDESYYLIDGQICVDCMKKEEIDWEEKEKIYKAKLLEEKKENELHELQFQIDCSKGRIRSHENQKAYFDDQKAYFDAEIVEERKNIALQEIELEKKRKKQ